MAVAAMLALFACENDPFYYNDQARIRMVGPEVWTLGTDSLEFSFANYSSSITDTTFDVTVYVMGEASEMDRVAAFDIDAGLTTAESTMYNFPTAVTIPAGAYSANLPITISRDASLKDGAARLYVMVKENDDFKLGVNEENHLLVIYSDVLSKPSNWNDLEEFFGEYSLVKYQFIIDQLNLATFDTDVLTWAQMKNYQIVLAEALRVYNLEHPGDPLTDENGQQVTF